MPYYISPPPMNPLSRLLATILALLALAGAFFFGIFVLALAVGIGIVAWLVISVRLWWLRKKGVAVARPGPGINQGPAHDSRKARHDSIDAEYTVVSRRDDD